MLPDSQTQLSGVSITNSILILGGVTIGDYEYRKISILDEILKSFFCEQD